MKLRRMLEGDNSDVTAVRRQNQFQIAFMQLTGRP